MSRRFEIYLSLDRWMICHGFQARLSMRIWDILLGMKPHAKFRFHQVTIATGRQYTRNNIYRKLRNEWWTSFLREIIGVFVGPSARVERKLREAFWNGPPAERSLCWTLRGLVKKELQNIQTRFSGNFLRRFSSTSSCLSSVLSQDLAPSLLGVEMLELPSVPSCHFTTLKLSYDRGLC